MGHDTPLGHHTKRGTMDLGQYNNLGEYCRPHTASEVFLVLIFCDPHVFVKRNHLLIWLAMYDARSKARIWGGGS